MQPELYSRNSDPVTSKLAASQLSAHKTKKRATLVAKAISIKPGLTTMELASRGNQTDWHLRHIFARVTPVAERMGFVVRGERRKCRVTGRVALTWHAVANLSERIKLFED